MYQIIVQLVKVNTIAILLTQHVTILYKIINNKNKIKIKNKIKSK